jgi:uncharacterized protein (TIGR02594 family)
MQKNYEWLLQEPGPKIILEWIKIYGTKEIAGRKHNPTIIGWATEVEVTNYKADEVPWCGLAMAVVAQRAGKQIPDRVLWALNWTKFGTRVPEAALGDTLVFIREGGGHVGTYVGEDSSAYHVFGGNQGDRVSIARIVKSRLVAIRRPVYSIAQPPNVRKIILSDDGEISNNEK